LARELVPSVFLNLYLMRIFILGLLCLFAGYAAFLSCCLLQACLLICFCLLSSSLVAEVSLLQSCWFSVICCLGPCCAGSFSYALTMPIFWHVDGAVFLPVCSYFEVSYCSVVGRCAGALPACSIS